MTTNDEHRPTRPRRAASGLVGTVTITVEQIYEAVMSLTARVNTSLARGELVEQKVNDHESRIRLLEQLRWPLPSAALLLSLIGIAIAIFR